MEISERERTELKYLKGRLSKSLTLRNAASSFISLGWLSALSLLSIPLYIKILGTTEWGIVAACLSLQILFSLIDAGLSQIIPKWTVRASDNFALLKAYILFFRRIFLIVGTVVFFALQALASYIAHDWFNVSSERAGSLELAVRIAAFQFLFQFLNNVNIAIWNGLQQQLKANIRTCVFFTLKHLVAILALTISSAEAWVYVISFATVAGLEAIVNSKTLNKMIVKQSTNFYITRSFSSNFFKDISILSTSVLVGLLVSNIDKIVLSKNVTVDDFGIYTVVASLALAFLQLQIPVTRALFPLLVKEIDHTGKVSFYHLKVLGIATLLVCTFPTLISAIYSHKILSFWIDDSNFIDVGSQPLTLILISVALNSIYGCIYQVMLASGHSKKIMSINMISFVFASMTVFFSTKPITIELGGEIWLTIAITQLTLGLLWLAKYGLKIEESLF